MTPSIVIMRSQTCLSRRPFTASRPARLVCAQLRSSSSDTPSAPPLLLKLRNDLKTAMKAKDRTRLNVVKAVLNEVTNSAKTNAPIKTDMQLLSLLRKRVASSQVACKEFEDAGRNDLRELEDAEIAVLGEYAGAIHSMSEDQVKAAVIKVVTDLRSQDSKLIIGDVLRRLIGPGGELEGSAVENALVARLVKEHLS